MEQVHYLQRDYVLAVQEGDDARAAQIAAELTERGADIPEVGE